MEKGELKKWLEHQISLRNEFIETTIFLNSQNLNGRETEDELYKQGISDCFDDLIEKINQLNETL